MSLSSLWKILFYELNLKDTEWYLAELNFTVLLLIKRNTFHSLTEAPEQEDVSQGC